MVISRDILNFFKKHNIDFKNLATNNTSYIESTRDINELIYKYGFFDDEKDAEISIADITGYNFFDNQNERNIFYAINNFFNSNGSLYQKRSVGMLDYSSDEIMAKLAKSFKDQPICVDYLPKEKYLISRNGLHRYMILRTHFLTESYGLDHNSPQHLELKEKYRLPVKVRKVDLIKTYANYILSFHPEFFHDLKLERNETNTLTGRVILTINSKDYILDDDELIDYVNDVIINTKDQKFIDRINNYAQKYESFKKFIEKNFSYLLQDRLEIQGGKIK